MKITYYMNNRDEVLSIKDDEGKTIKEGAYHLGNCLIDILYGRTIIENGNAIEIDSSLKNKITDFLYKCDDYLKNDIKSIVENELPFIFRQKFSYQNVFIENKLCRVYFFDDIDSLICMLLTNIYLKKLMYKRCDYCNRLFATRFSNARFCKRTATRSGKTCGYAYALEQIRKIRKYNYLKGK